MSTDDSDVMISVRGLSKSYTIAHNAKDRPTTLAEAAVRRLRAPFRRHEQETFWALQDVSFDVNRGDIVGVIGRNGAGKSTLLKILSRITEPTKGSVDLYGRVGSLLEVGTGFSAELTGRENVFLNGTILGMKRSEIAKRFDEIVDFAGVEKFLDTPVKRYSSGMYVRLAFAVAAHLHTEILIVDEVLAVGDAEFQNKCITKMQKTSSDTGKTILFVSHNIAAIQRLCGHVLYLSSGQLQYLGPASDGIQAYMSAGRKVSTNGLTKASELYEVDTRNVAEGFCVTKLELLSTDGRSMSHIRTGDAFVLRLHVFAPRDERLGAAYIVLTGPNGVRMSVLSSRPEGQFDLPLTSGTQTIDCKVFRLPLAAGTYSLSFGLTVPNVEFLWQAVSVASLEVQENDVFGSGLAPTYDRYPVVIDHEWSLSAP